MGLQTIIIYLLYSQMTWQAVGISYYICKLLSKWCKALQVDNAPNIGESELEMQVVGQSKVSKNAKSKRKKLSEIPTPLIILAPSSEILVLHSSGEVLNFWIAKCQTKNNSLGQQNYSPFQNSWQHTSGITYRYFFI